MEDQEPESEGEIKSDIKSTNITFHQHPKYQHTRLSAEVRRSF